MTTKAELVTAIAEKAGINKNQAKDALEAFIDAVTSSLKSGEDVRWSASAPSRLSLAPRAPRATRAPARP
jgi:DNA-binding protein HU-beta